MAFYEKGEHYVQERHTKNGYSKEILDEEQWQRGTPVFVKHERFPTNDRYRDDARASFGSNNGRYVKVPGERIVDDYRRVDYSYEDEDHGFYIRRPHSNHSSINRQEEPIFNIRHSRSDIGSPGNLNNNRNAISRPGSPGPVAGIGDIINTEHGFTIQLDVKHFRPEEIQVVLKDDLLCISGERIEDCGDGQTLRRSFSRKYSIPSDIHLDSIRSHIAENGVLFVNGSRRGWKETNLSYHGVGTRHGRSGSVISTV